MRRISHAENVAQSAQGLTPHRRGQSNRIHARQSVGASATPARELANALPQEMPIMRGDLARKADLLITGGASLDRAAARFQ